MDASFTSVNHRTVIQPRFDSSSWMPRVDSSRVAEQARSVILVGGTLAPIDELVTQLCPDLKLAQTSSENDVNRRLMTFTCGHIIPRDNLLPVALPAGPTGTPFDFTHAARSDVKVMDELGRVVINASRVAPGGVCVFFPSFKYADDVYERWATTGRALPRCAAG